MIRRYAAQQALAKLTQFDRRLLVMKVLTFAWLWPYNIAPTTL